MFAVSYIKGLASLNLKVKPQVAYIVKLSKRKYLSVPKDVNIYKNNGGAGFARLVGVAGLGQWIVITYMSSVTFQNMPAFFKWIPAEKSEDKESQRLPLADWKYRIGFATFTFGAACAMMVTTYMYCFRSVSSITLLKSSDQVLFSTYTPLGSIRHFKISVRDVSAVQPRSSKMTQVPLKLKDHYFHYLVDKSGQFPQPSLFDRTVGIKRNFGMGKKK